MNDSFRLTGRSTGGDHQRIVDFGVDAVGEVSSPVEVDDDVGPHRPHDRIFGDVGQPMVDGKNGITAIPGSSNLVDEVVSSRKIDGDETRHERTLGVKSANDQIVRLPSHLACRREQMVGRCASTNSSGSRGAGGGRRRRRGG